ncbi:hypothetical protein HPB48_007727 [Haemaphysalis longicornis]|uniref:Calponin-homology (CH) domain-containing protein n=1 Tax=Haemaphysalis longicornis TaxID=44386 RepID=A0A9J6G5G2_HAELO|nr:hypothetical protein HPB48_007727 [Haemaphysalis longicornis]
MVKGDEFVWVEIQEKTFTNWVNEQLRPGGAGVVSDLRRDLSDGLRLVALVEALQKRRLRCITRPLNQHQCLENVQNALAAMAQDNIKLVNIAYATGGEGGIWNAAAALVCASFLLSPQTTAAADLEIGPRCSDSGADKRVVALFVIRSSPGPFCCRSRARSSFADYLLWFARDVEQWISGVAFRQEKLRRRADRRPRARAPGKAGCRPVPPTSCVFEP